MQDKPFWAERIERQRLAHAWTQNDAIQALRKVSDRNLPDDESLLKNWKSWETGKHKPNLQYQRLISKAFSTVSLAIFGDKNTSPMAKNMSTNAGTINTDELLEVLERTKRSDIDDNLIHKLECNVEDLCERYSYDNNVLLTKEAVKWIEDLNGIRSSKLTSGQHSKIIEMTGWLTLLVGCLSWDRSDFRVAETARRSGLKIGQEINCIRIQAWAQEMNGWFSITQGNWERVLSSVQLGLQIAGNLDVAAQIASQEAEAWARLGEPEKAQRALGHSLQILEALSAASNPDNHFIVDHDKFDKIAMKLACLSGQDAQTMSFSSELKRTFTRNDGTYSKPMRIAEAINAEAIVTARCGDLAKAIQLGHDAIDIKRQSIPSLMQDAKDLIDCLKNIGPNNASVKEYIERIEQLSLQT